HVECDELGPTCIGLGKTHRTLDRLGSACAEEGLLEPGRRHLGKSLCEIGNNRHLVENGTAVHEPLHLVPSGVDYPRVAMASINHCDASEAIHILETVDRPDCRTCGSVEPQ